MDKKNIKEADFSREADILKTIGHPVRLKIVAGLIGDECCVKDIWQCLGLPQPVVSQHLSVLRNRGIVTAKREGNKTLYYVTDPLAIDIVETINRFKRKRR